jgi:hypothetical protein
MRPKNGRLVLPWTIGALVLVLLALAACADVEVVDKTPVASTPAPVTRPSGAGPESHNLAVLAVDFDPPLDYEQLIIRRQSVALLVAVENTGTQTERDITVRAQLSAPADPDFVLTQGASLASLAPGEIQVVRFARLGEVPYYQAYYLEVVVDPVEGEIELSDNRRAFDIQIHQK